MSNPSTERCVLCRARRSSSAERAIVRSNVRRFVDERFAVWRCGSCGSIHADGAVDVASYYGGYPMHRIDLDWRVRAVYHRLLGRLVRAGVRAEHRILDYGCGSGAFISFLQKVGYRNAVGYDPHHTAFAKESLLSEKYDCVLAQDVLEHGENPWTLLEILRGLSTSGGLLAIGTPNASAIDLGRPESYVHTLHQPYHRHILSKTGLLNLGAPFAWKLLAYHPQSYIDTRVPFINGRFLLHYLRSRDDTFDAAFEPVEPSLRLLSPRGLFWGLWGSFLARETDVMVVYRATR